MTASPRGLRRPSLRELGAGGPAWSALLRAHALLTRAMAEALETEIGIPLSTYDVLAQLALAPQQCLRMAELADRVLLSRPGLTGVVGRLESEGLVRRERSRDDGRGLYAVITAGGLDLLDRAHPVHVASIRAHFADRYDEPELIALSDLLGRVAREDWRATTADCPPA